jgi:hypothetical protein
MTTLRHGLREEQFRRYEPMIAKITHNWPQPTFFAPEAPIRSLETLRGRLRDAMLSFYKHRWASAVDYQAFCALYPESMCSIADNQVMVAPKGYQAQTVNAGQAVLARGLTVSTEHPEVIKSLLVLHHHSVLIAPTEVHTSLELDAFAASYDVSVQTDKPNIYTIL